MAELTASDGISGDDFGNAVAVSGNTVVVGAPNVTVGSNVEQGKAYVFVKPANGWSNMTQVAELIPSNGSEGLKFGISVAVSGNTIVVGSLSGNGEPMVYVFVKLASGWKDMTETLQLGGGIWVAIDGNTIVTSTGQGIADVYVAGKKGWAFGAQSGGELTASDGTSQDQFGTSLAISGDTVLVGAPYGYANPPGAAYVFVKPANGWPSMMTQTAKLIASNGATYNFFGQAVAINSGTIVVGAPELYSYPPPTAYVFVKPVGGWSNTTETAQLTGVHERNPYFASSVAVSGSRIVVGEAGGDLAHNFQGASYIFTKPKIGWQTTSKYNAVLRASGDTGKSDAFGWSVAMSGARIVIGATEFLNGPGTAYVF